ncbi:MAG: hypothetical protein U0940_01520, partial [Nitrospirota bacterium]|nr:hypothetical protein [Nitrospirota bacterium]
FGVGEDFSNRPWFIAPLKGGKTYTTDFYKSIVTDALCITISTPVRDNAGTMMGIFGVDLKFEEVLKIERRMESGRSFEDEGKGGVEGEIV